MPGDASPRGATVADVELTDTLTRPRASSRPASFVPRMPSQAFAVSRHTKHVPTPDRRLHARGHPHAAAVDRPWRRPDRYRLSGRRRRSDHHRTEPARSDLAGVAGPPRRVDPSRARPRARPPALGFPRDLVVAAVAVVSRCRRRRSAGHRRVAGPVGGSATTGDAGRLPTAGARDGDGSRRRCRTASHPAVPVRRSLARPARRIVGRHAGGVRSGRTAGPLALGWAVAAAVHLAVGSPGGLPSAERIQAGLLGLGVEADVLDIGSRQGVVWAHAREADGRELDVKVYGRDAWDGQLLVSVWRFLWYRDGGPTLSLTWTCSRSSTKPS